MHWSMFERTHVCNSSFCDCIESLVLHMYLRGFAQHRPHQRHLDCPPALPTSAITTCVRPNIEQCIWPTACVVPTLVYITFMAYFVSLYHFLVDRHDGMAGAMRKTEPECR
jgi:hypothetical protein